MILIDHGISQNYLNPDGTHRENKKVEEFLGNSVFASKNAFSGQTMSRRDDIIQIAYLLIYIID